MKIDEKYCKEKISKIDNLLNDEKLLKKYILDIESSKFEIPQNIQENIKLEFNKNIRLTKKQYSFFNICKVACFCLVVMITWTLMTNISFDNEKQIRKDENNIEDENKISVIYGKVTEYTNSFSKLLLSPVEIERGN